MSTNLRASLAREKIYNFMADIKLNKDSLEENIKLKHSFNMYVRNDLQNYIPSLNEHENLKCFIHAAKTKHDISNNDIYYIETARSTFCGSMMGILLCGAIPTVLCNLFDLSGFTLKTIFTVGGAIGGTYGFYAGLNLIQNNLEQEVSWHEVIKCVDNAPKLELSGETPVNEVI